MLAYAFQPGGAMDLARHEEPRLRAGDVLVDVISAGVCGTDLKIARGEHRRFPPGTHRIPGHELVGRVATAGGTPTGPAVGDLVAVAPNMACDTCGPCRRGRGNLCASYEALGLTVNGAFAQRVRIPARAVAQGNVVPLAADVDPDLAVLMEPVAAVLRGLDAVALDKGDTLVVAGAGPTGLIALLLAKRRGVERVIVSQPSAHRRHLAGELGADHTLDPTACDVVAEVRRLSGGEGADVVMVTTPVGHVFAQSLEMAAVGGRVNFFAGLPPRAGRVELDANLVHYRELTVTGTTANTTEDCRRALDLLLADPAVFAPLVTHRYPLRDAERAFADAAGGGALKVVLHP
ncbi:MAG: zinc-binding dehydrogenase [Streptosporangiales bacterium]|nr:zinc-binding dehydrogenase [Streptosporangiales bacterium]